MNFFKRRNKNKRTIEEQNKVNREYWKKNNVVKDDIEKLMKEFGISEEDMIKYIAISDEGKNISNEGKEYWICNHCIRVVRFTSRDDYIAHHFREHG